MSESKISCPNCGQHILAGEEWAGLTVNCPSCQRPIVIPGTPITVAAPAPRSPANPPTAAASASGASRTSGLAITSLVLSLLGCFFLTAIAGVICGHLARKRIRRDPSLTGGGLALAALIIGYILIALWVAWLTFFAVNFKDAFNRAREQAEARRSGLPASRNESLPDGVTMTSKSGEKKKLPVPADAVAGQIKGQTFTYSSSSLHETMSLLTVQDGEEFFADREVKIFLFAKSGESLANRTWNITAASTGMRPHVHLTWQDNGNRKTEIVTSGYQMELKTGAITDGVITGTLNLKVTGKTPAELKGSFTAVLE